MYTNFIESYIYLHIFRSENLSRNFINFFYIHSNKYSIEEKKNINIFICMIITILFPFFKHFSNLISTEISKIIAINEKQDIKFNTCVCGKWFVTIPIVPHSRAFIQALYDVIIQMFDHEIALPQWR